MRQQTEQAKLEFEHSKLALIKEGKLMATDDYVLTHRNSFSEPRLGSVNRESFGRPLKHFPSDKQSGSHLGDSDKLCNYCHKRGHWKADCQWLRSKSKSTFGDHAKGVALAVPARQFVTSEVVHDTDSCPEMDSYRPFITEGFVSMVGSDTKVPVTILRDTGAFDSFIRVGVLPLSKDTETGSSVPVRGMDLSVLWVPVHNVTLQCDLFQGEAGLALRPVLPIPGVSVILGNDLLGARVWAGVSPPVVVAPTPLARLKPDENERDFPEIFSACAVTRAMVAAKSKVDTDKEGVRERFALPLSDYPLSISRSDLVAEQQSDPSLKKLFDQVRPASEVWDSASGYFCHDSLL
ncbi:uncharacterized protein LOC113092869, partial [Xyrichtys novacula]